MIRVQSYVAGAWYTGSGQSTVLAGLAQDGASLWRSNFGFVEVMGQSCTVQADLLAADGTVAPFEGDMDEYARFVLDRAKGGTAAHVPGEKRGQPCPNRVRFFGARKSFYCAIRSD